MEYLDGVNLKELDLSVKNRIGSGYYGSVYRLQDTNGKKSDKYVVKKMKFNFVEKTFNRLGKSGKIPFQLQSVLSKRDMFAREVKKLEELQIYDFVPRIFYSDPSIYVYVMEKLDITLYSLMYTVKTRFLTPEMGYKLVELIDKYFKAPIYHSDLHLDNVMWSDSLNKFVIIDWGYYYTIPTVEGNNTKQNTTNKYYINKIEETLKYNDRILKALWKFCNSKIKKRDSYSTEWEALKNYIKQYIETEFPENKQKYIGYLESTLKGLGVELPKLFGGKVKKSKKNNCKKCRKNTRKRI